MRQELIQLLHFFAAPQSEQDKALKKSGLNLLKQGSARG